MSKKFKDRRIPVEVIIAATEGDATAVQTVLKAYEGYIRNKCIKNVSKLSMTRGGLCTTV